MGWKREGRLGFGDQSAVVGKVKGEDGAVAPGGSLILPWNVGPRSSQTDKASPGVVLG